MSDRSNSTDESASVAHAAAEALRALALGLPGAYEEFPRARSL